ncbi:ATP-binding protein [Nostoc sp.]|uniref:ATP-binding protein n=1 Tax=Nostoc sp. TaxID=1180 RepID=UPI002FF8442C
MMTEFSKFHNPYDFSNPVLDIDVFAGREKELEEIRYYLEQARTAPQPINLVLLGQRASGKTSLLNITEIEGGLRNFCTVRIDLDEGDAETQFAFFYKLFDGLLLAACELGAFGGIEGKTYDTYLDVINAYKIPDNSSFCAFIFPTQYAKAMSCGNINMSLSDNSYKRDLRAIQKELNKPVLLLFDECNVLSQSRIHLEKIRNIFMNLPGYMLVFTGTPDLFPVIDQIFSPIIRQFKKVNLVEFETKEETNDCIRKPLEKLGIILEEIFDIETYRDVSEIHDLSGGRPYEIQLICHFLFRRIQNKQATRMKLNLSVLEEIRRELENFQDISTRPVLSKIRNLNKQQLQALKLLTASCKNANFEQLWTIEYLFNGEINWSKNVLEQEYQYLLKESIIKLHNQGIEIDFNGDDFDKIYAKYLAREGKVSLSLSNRPLELLIHIKIDFLKKDIEGLKQIELFLVSSTGHIRNSLWNSMSLNNEDVFDDPALGIPLYKAMLDYRNNETIPVVSVKLDLHWLKVKFWYYPEKPNFINAIDEFIEKLAVIKNRIHQINGDLTIELENLKLIPIELLSNKIQDLYHGKYNQILTNYHVQKTFVEYLDKNNSKEALFHGKLAYYYNSSDISIQINLSYLFLVNDDVDKAKELLQKALQNGISDSELLALADYNMGIAEIKSSNLIASLEQINLCIETSQNLECSDRICSCLLIPKINNGQIIFVEVRDKDLLEVACEARTNLEYWLKFSEN